MMQFNLFIDAVSSSAKMPFKTALFLDFSCWSWGIFIFWNISSFFIETCKWWSWIPTKSCFLLMYFLASYITISVRPYHRYFPEVFSLSLRRDWRPWRELWKTSRERSAKWQNGALTKPIRFLLGWGMNSWDDCKLHFFWGKSKKLQDGNFGWFSRKKCINIMTFVNVGSESFDEVKR